MFTSRCYLNLGVAGALFSALALSSCDSNGIYEDLNPCETDHKVTFKFDYNMLKADAFSSQVHSVGVYGFNKTTGQLEFMLSERGDKLAADGFAVDMDGVEPGDYDLVVWGGLDNSQNGGGEENFRLTGAVIGESTKEDMICRLQRQINADGSHHSSAELYSLFYGNISDVTVHEPDATPGEHHSYNVPLKKNTNHINIILQQLSGKDINAAGFTYTVSDNNGTMNVDNDVDDEMPEITYHPFEVIEGEAGLELDDYPDSQSRSWTMPVRLPQYWLPGQRPAGLTRADKPVKVAIARIDISRLVYGHHTRIRIYNPEGKRIASIPLQDYALLNKRGISDDQEYLDREDNYDMTFFLDSNQEWISSSIIINSWKVKLNNGSFE